MSGPRFRCLRPRSRHSDGSSYLASIPCIRESSGPYRNGPGFRGHANRARSRQSIRSDQQTCFVSDVQPSIRYWANAEPEAVPVHLVWNFDKQFPYPRLVPWQGTRKWIFKKTVERDVGTAHEVHTAVEICSFGSGIEAEFPHAETSCDAVASSIGFKHIKTGRFWRPQTRPCDRQFL